MCDTVGPTNTSEVESVPVCAMYDVRWTCGDTCETSVVSESAGEIKRTRCNEHVAYE